MGLCSLAVVALLALADVRSAEVGLGGTCTDSDTCCHATLQLACSLKDGDTVKTCLIKAGQACETGSDNYCVSGATCTSSMCSCEGTEYTESSGICNVTNADKWAGPCPMAGCMGAGLECNSDLSMCICSAGKNVDLAAGTCADITTGKIGFACSGATCGANQECSGDKCICSAGYTGVLGGECTAIADARAGTACTDTDKAAKCGTTTTTFLECPNGGGNCACQAGFASFPGTSCYPAIGQLNTCCSGTGKGTCSVDTLECTSSLCKSKAGGICTMASDCTDTSSMVCDSLTNKCLLKLTQVCTGNENNCISGAKCTGTSGTTCECDATISTTNSDVCDPKPGYVGGSCSTTGTIVECIDGNSECTGAGSTCTCKTDFTVVSSTLTCTASKGGRCTTASVLVLLLMGIISQMLIRQ